MDAATKQAVEKAGVLRGLWIWLASPPDNRRWNLVDRVSLTISRLAMALLVLVVLITFYEVIARYVFRSATLWANELVLWMGSFIFLISGVYAMQRRSHIRITAAYEMMGPRLRWCCNLFATAIIVVYAYLFIVPSLPEAWEVLSTWKRFGTYWDPPIPATVKPACMLATLFVAAQAVSNFFMDQRDVLDGTEEGEAPTAAD
ncbi:MAG: TRAP transporter small permease [Betaproteobacteria bacterium AqS2]|uniref:TRAP transporter small permease protein n=1 Tax=Candidatus Amphirhobacter heronislandensis TaxID=1732024 RepID=A0A930UGJ9_9GAMM|nr:TRAP transporter small permease [Betaproteobacteria bacterium AqS2]